MRFQLFTALSAGVAVAQQFVPTPRDLTSVTSELFPGAEISFKKTSVCETTAGVDSYSGYVKLPKQLLPDAAGWEDDQAAHIFFWYFEAREDPENAPTSIYIGGGPGTSSFDGNSDFPCFFNADGNSTTINEFSYNNRVNMLYIDQPAQTGFSYVALQNSTMDFVTGQVVALEEGGDLPELNVTTRQATLDARGPATATNTTASAARTMWTFAQVWFNEFPHWQTESEDISLWTVSYGGFYGPGVFEYIQEQNKRILAEDSSLPNATVLNLATLGLADACIDARAMSQGYATFSFNNTYGLEVYDEETYKVVMQNLTDLETGCYGLIDNCRALAAVGDPDGFGTNETVNKACVQASGLCFAELQGAYQLLSDRNVFDVTVSNITTDPTRFQSAFLNQPWVQEDLGVPLNFTLASASITEAFFARTGDPMRRSIGSLESVLDSGVKVALIYGDRDYRCNWYGGENVSLSLEFDAADMFRDSGYQPIVTNTSYEGGLVREHGPLSFSRIYQAGHGVAGYQPETLSRVFDRVMFGHDVSTGKVSLSDFDDFATKGPKTVYDVLNEVPEPMENICFLPLASTTCTREQKMALLNGTAVLDEWVVVEPKGAVAAALESKNPGKGDKSGGGVDDNPKTDGSSQTAIGLVSRLFPAAALVFVFA